MPDREPSAAEALFGHLPRGTPEPVEDLATLVARRRARMNRILALPLEERSALIPGVGRNGNGNGSDDDHS